MYRRIDSTEIDKQVNEFIDREYKIEKYITSTLESKTEKRELKIFLHSLEGEKVQLKLDNLLDDNIQREYNINKSTKIKFPYDNISFSNQYKDSSEVLNIFDKFFTFINKYYYNNRNSEGPSIDALLNVPDKNDKRNAKCKLRDQGVTQIKKKDIENKIFIKNLVCSSNDPFEDTTLVDDIYIYTKLFFQTSLSKLGVFTDVFGYDYAYNAERDPRYTPSSIRISTQKNIFTKYKRYLYNEDVTEPDDEYKKVVTFHNVYTIVKKLLPIKHKLRFIVDETNKYKDFIVTRDLQLNEKHKDLHKINDSTIELHFDIGIERFEKTENIKFFLNLTGDIKKKNIEFTPSMLDPKNTAYKKNDIYFTNKFKLTNPILEKDVFKTKYGDKLDKRLFFLDKEIMKFLTDYLEKNPQTKKTDKEESPEITEKEKNKIHRNNVDLIIKYFFEQSDDPKHRNYGKIFYQDKEYFINRVSNRDYYLGDPKKFDTIDINFTDATVSLEYEDFRVKYDKNINVYVDKTARQLLEIDPSNLKLSDKLKYFKQYKQQIFTTKDVTFDNSNINTTSVNLKTTIYDTSLNKNFDIDINNIPFNSVDIVVDSRNNKLFKDIEYIYNQKDKKKYTLNKDDKTVFESGLDQGIFKVNDVGSQINNSLTSKDNASDKTLYKVSIDLNVLDKSAGDITFTRKLLSSTCNDKCKQIDKSITTTFSPLLNGTNFNFFSDLLDIGKKRDKFQKLIEEKFPDQVKKASKDNKDSKDSKDNKDSKMKGGKSNKYTRKLSKFRNKNKLGKKYSVKVKKILLKNLKHFIKLKKIKKINKDKDNRKKYRSVKKYKLKKQGTKKYKHRRHN